MFNTGEKIKIFDSDAVVLTSHEDEILLYFEKGYTKWVEKSVIQLMQVS